MARRCLASIAWKDLQTKENDFLSSEFEERWSRMVKTSSSERESNGLLVSRASCLFMTNRKIEKKISVNASRFRRKKNYGSSDSKGARARTAHGGGGGEINMELHSSGVTVNGRYQMISFSGFEKFLEVRESD